MISVTRAFASSQNLLKAKMEEIKRYAQFSSVSIEKKVGCILPLISIFCEL